MVAAADRVAGRVRYHATHGGEFLGIPATGRTVEFEAFHIARFRGHEIVEWWGGTDLLGVVQQLGAGITPPPDD